MASSTVAIAANAGFTAPKDPARSGGAPAGDGTNYLDRIAGKTFLTPMGRWIITINEKGEWRLRAPDHTASYIARNPGGDYSYWITSPIGMRFAATGSIGGRGVGMCWHSYCQYWLAAADGTPFYLQTVVKKDGRVKLLGLQVMAEDGTPSAFAAVERWGKRDGDPGYLVMKKKATPEQVLGFSLEYIEDWISGAATHVPASNIATAAPAEAPAALAARPNAAPQPVSVAAAFTPVDRFGPLAYLVGHDWLITVICNGAINSKVVSRVGWTGQPGGELEQRFADGSVSTWRVGKQPATLVRKYSGGGKTTWQVEPAAISTSGERLEVTNGKIVGSGSCTAEYAQLQDGVFDEARAENIRLAAEARANRPKGGGFLRALGQTLLFPAKVALVIGEALVANPGAFAAGVSNGGNTAWQPSTPSDWAARINGNAGAVGDMGGVTHVAAPRMTPQQQAQFDETERFKMREQMARGERATTFADDAYARADAESARRAAEERARPTPAPQPTETEANSNSDSAAAEATGATEVERNAEVERKAGEARKAEEARKVEEARKAEEARRAEELAKAEKARQERLAAEEAARKKREAEERAANEPIEWKEGVVLCEPAKAPSHDATCHGPLQTTWGALGEQSGNIALAQACGGDTSVREMGQAAGYLVFGCGWGIHPLRTNSDVPARLGVGFIADRRVFHCPPKQTTVCTSP